MIAAGIVTYEPEIDRLAENVRSIAGQVDRVFVVDNGSSNVAAIEEVVHAVEGATLVKSASNDGIAAALNVASSVASVEGHEWLVTLDQDSVAPQGMVEELIAVAHASDAAMVTPFIVDRNKMTVEDYLAADMPRMHEFRQAARRGAITSGALTSLEALSSVGGFDDRFFIDYVDYDLNQRLLLAGRKIVRANRTYLLHEVGRAARTWLKVPRKDMDGTWRLETFYSFGHSPMRCYYKARNRVLFTRKHGREIGVSHEGIWQLPQQIALTVLFETGRWKKLAAFLRGIRDGIRLRL